LHRQLSFANHSAVVRAVGAAVGVSQINFIRVCRRLVAFPSRMPATVLRVLSHPDDGLGEAREVKGKS
jgi:hypothetical protein